MCPGCGTHHYAWSETQPCAGCKSQALENQLSLAALAREQREARRQEFVDRLERRGRPLSYGELPEGF